MSEGALLDPLGDSIADRAIATMRSPRDMHIICIDVTNRCDLRCSNCTRLLVNQDHHWDMTPDNFRTALRSLNGYQGVIAMIGGNPCLNKYFAELCGIFVEEIPNQRQRGLWSNNVFTYQELIRDTFGFFNLNPHNDDRCIASLEKLKEFIPSISYYKGNSTHAPLLTAVRDVIPDEQKMWDAIAGCDINRNWSASIVQHNGELRAYFCEVAASFDLARHGDHGVPVTEGWWRRSIVDYADQVKRFCPGCGVPARLKGHLDKDETDDFSATNADIAGASRGRRKTIAVEAPEAVERTTRPVTDYTEQHVAPVRAAVRAGTLVSVVIPCFNAADTIVETIESVLAQRKPGVVDVDIIVSDDKSTDDSLQKIAALAAAHPRAIRYVPTTINAGPATARNRGLKHARGDLVCFLDADDCYVPGFFELAVAAFAADPALGAIYTAVSLVDNHRTVHPLHLNAVASSIPSNVMVRRGIVEVLGGFPEDAAFRGPTAGEDVVFRRMLSDNFKVRYIDEPCLRYRVRRGSHFDAFIDSTEIIDGAMHSTGVAAVDADGTRPAAAAAHRSRFAGRVQALERCRTDRPFDPQGLMMVQQYDGLRARIGDAAGVEGFYLFRCAVMSPGRGYIGVPGRLAAAPRACLDEGSRSTGRLPTVTMEEVVGSGQNPRVRMLVLDIQPDDDRWIEEFRQAFPFLNPTAYVAFLGLPGDGRTGIPDVLRMTGVSWSEVGRVGRVGVFART
jgi:organic radical activating enzyme